MSDRDPVYNDSTFGERSTIWCQVAVFVAAPLAACLIYRLSCWIIRRYELKTYKSAKENENRAIQEKINWDIGEFIKSLKFESPKPSISFEDFKGSEVTLDWIKTNVYMPLADIANGRKAYPIKGIIIKDTQKSDRNDRNLPEILCSELNQYNLECLRLDPTILAKDSVRKINTVLDYVIHNQPIIVFIEEFDTIVKESNEVMALLRSFFSGLRSDDGVVIVAIVEDTRSIVPAILELFVSPRE